MHVPKTQMETEHVDKTAKSKIKRGRKESINYLFRVMKTLELEYWPGIFPSNRSVVVFALSIGSGTAFIHVPNIQRKPCLEH